jgi:hypothetical protein
MLYAVRRAALRTSLCLLLVGVLPPLARGQDTEPAKPAPTGLPSMIDWTFNFDAAWGGFGFANSFFADPKEHTPVDVGDRWFEGYAKPALSGVRTFSDMSRLYGKLSVVGERTYAPREPAPSPIASSFAPEDMYIGWKSGKKWEHLGEDAVDVSVGREPYQIGHGMLLWDGAAEGGSRGGYWTNARKSWGLAGVTRFKPGKHTAEAFFLKRNDLPERDTETRVAGANYDYKVNDNSTFGATYMSWWADPFFYSTRNGEDVLNFRAYTAPIPSLTDLSFNAEYARERNGDLLRSTAWNAQGTYTFSTVTWTPAVSYRYAIFEGDDPATPESEAFDSLQTGFYDWGTWWQGEIGGEYFLSNSNLVSHLVRVNVTPRKSITTGVFLYKFLLDEPSTFASGVTSRDLAFETDWYMDWKINKNFTASFVAAYADPDAAVEQATGRTRNLRYGMVFLAYSY